MDERLAESLIDWLIAQSLAGRTEAELLTGLCERMVHAGVPLLRVSTATERLQPICWAHGVIWRRDGATEQESYPRVSSAFANASGNRRAELVSLGRYALKGVARPQELFTLDPGAADVIGRAN